MIQHNRASSLTLVRKQRSVFLHKEFVVREKKIGGEKHYCCEETGFWHNVDVWSKSNEFISAHESRKTCHDQMTKNQAFVSRKITDLNTQRFMGMCVWLVEKNGQHKATRMRNKFLPISIGSVCPVRFTMMAPKLDKDKVGICHYILFTNPNRLLGSHKKLCGETYASMVRKHIQTSDVKYDEQGASEAATKDHETEKCIFSKLKECTDKVPPMPCWVKPKTIPAVYKNRAARAGTEILATKFMREKLNYREKNPDGAICCPRTAMADFLTQFSTTNAYVNSKFRTTCMDIGKADQKERPIKTFQLAQFYSFCVITHEMNDGRINKIQFLTKMLQLRYDRTCTMWSFTHDVPNDKVICEFVRIVFHQADSETHWSNTHGDYCKPEEEPTVPPQGADGLLAGPDKANTTAAPSTLATQAHLQPLPFQPPYQHQLQVPVPQLPGHQPAWRPGLPHQVPQRPILPQPHLPQTHLPQRVPVPGAYGNQVPFQHNRQPVYRPPAPLPTRRTHVNRFIRRPYSRRGSHRSSRRTSGRRRLRGRSITDKEENASENKEVFVAKLYKTKLHNLKPVED